MTTQSKERRSATPRKPRRAASPGRDERSAIRREQLLSAALALFSAGGYAATSTRRIAEAAGVTEGLLFHYFPTKEALLLEVASRRHSFAGRVLLLVQEGGDRSARALLAAIAAGLAEVSREEGAFIGFLLAEAQVNASLRGLFTAGTEVVLEGFVAMLARRVAAGELRPESSLRAAAHGFFGGFLFFFSQHRHLGPEAWRREAAAFAQAWAEQCWRGIAALDQVSEHSTNETETRRPR